MKKIGILILLCFLFHYSQVNAKVFDLYKNDGYYYSLTWKSGNSSNIIQTYMYMITDKDNNFYYNIEPKSTMFSGKEYTKSNLLLEDEVYKKIAKIIHYGYGYKNHTNIDYYFATQYLIFKELGVTSIEIISRENKNNDYLKKEISEIKEVIEKNMFTSKIYYTDEDYIIIDDPYILEYYELKSDEIKVEKIDNSYKVSLLNKKEEYAIKLKSKNNCFPADYWLSENNPDLLGNSNLCEEDNKITVIRNIKEEIQQNPVVPEEDEEENNYIVEEKIEVTMPSTSKFSLTWLILIVLLGNVYYVCKK